MPKKTTTKAKGAPRRRGPRPGMRRTARTAAPARPMKRGPRGATPKQPFSLILEPDELSTLKKMARHQNTSVAAIIRQALHTVIFRSHPGLAKSAIENEVTSFLDHIGTKLPLGKGGPRRARLKKQMVSGLLSGIKTR